MSSQGSSRTKSNELKLINLFLYCLRIFARLKRSVPRDIFPDISQAVEILYPGFDDEAPTRVNRYLKSFFQDSPSLTKDHVKRQKIEHDVDYFWSNTPIGSPTDFSQTKSFVDVERPNGPMTFAARDGKWRRYTVHPTFHPRKRALPSPSSFPRKRLREDVVPIPMKFEEEKNSRLQALKATHAALRDLLNR